MTLQNTDSDNGVKWLHTYSSSVAEQVKDAIQEFEQLCDKRDVSLCCYMALVYAHKKKPNPGTVGPPWSLLIETLGILSKTLYITLSTYSI